MPCCSCNPAAGTLIITSVVARGVTLNPAVLATLTGVGLAVKGIAIFKKYDKKTERADFAPIEYKKTLDKKTFLDRLKIIDDFVSDECIEIPDKVKLKYASRFIAT